MRNKKTVLMTGVTGALGQELIKELARDKGTSFYLLSRRKKRHSHWDRVRKLLAGTSFEKLLGTRFHVLEGDITLPGFGLQPYEIERLRAEVTDFFHVAALTALNGTEEDCNRMNIEGVDNALSLAREMHQNGNLRRFFYFSTAYVAGSRQTYHAMEDGLPSEPAFANFYESSKYHAESKVRQALAEGLPVTIFRPSIVVGHSETGKVSEFNVIYPFMKLFAHGIITVLPTHPDNSFNIVPIDFVVKASVHLAGREDTLGKTYHLVSDHPPTIGMLLGLKDELYPGMPEIRMLSPEEFKPESLDLNGQMAYAMLQPYLGYLNDHLTFDTRNTHEALDGTDIVFPKTDYEFLKTMVGFAVDEGYLVAHH